MSSVVRFSYDMDGGHNNVIKMKVDQKFSDEVELGNGADICKINDSYLQFLTSMGFETQDVLDSFLKTFTVFITSGLIDWNDSSLLEQMDAALEKATADIMQLGASAQKTEKPSEKKRSSYQKVTAEAVANFQKQVAESTDFAEKALRVFLRDLET